MKNYFSKMNIRMFFLMLIFSFAILAKQSGADENDIISTCSTGCNGSSIEISCPYMDCYATQFSVACVVDGDVIRNVVCQE